MGNIVSYPTSPRLLAPPLCVQPDFLTTSPGQLSRAYHCRSWTLLSAADATGASVRLSNLCVLAKALSITAGMQDLPVSMPVLAALWALLLCCPEEAVGTAG